VQVDSIKTRIESAYGVCNQRLTPEHHELLAKVGFEFNPRRCIEGELALCLTAMRERQVGRCKLNP